MTGDGARADSGYRLALALFDSLPEPEPVDRGAAQFALANRLLFKGAYAQAESAARRALRIYTRWNGPDNMLAAHSRVSLSMAAMTQNQLPRALAEVDTALRILECKTVSVLEKTRIQLQQARVLSNMGRVEEAGTLAEDVLARRRVAIPDEPLMMGEATQILGEIRIRQWRITEAEALLLEAYRNYGQAMGKTSALANGVASGLVFLYAAIGKPDRAVLYAADLPPDFVARQQVAARKFAATRQPARK